MKTITIFILGILVLSLFIGVYFYNNPMPYDEYYGIGDYETQCEFKHLDNGYTQLENCARYKIKDIYLRKVNG